MVARAVRLARPEQPALPALAVPAEAAEGQAPPVVLERAGQALAVPPEQEVLAVRPE